jgi:hypothetical protein
MKAFATATKSSPRTAPVALLSSARSVTALVNGATVAASMAHVARARDSAALETAPMVTVILSETRAGSDIRTLCPGGALRRTSLLGYAG